MQQQEDEDQVLRCQFRVMKNLIWLRARCTVCPRLRREQAARSEASPQTCRGGLPVIAKSPRETAGERSPREYKTLARDQQTDVA